MYNSVVVLHVLCWPAAQEVVTEASRIDIERSEFCRDCGAWMDPFQADFFGYWDDLRRESRAGPAD